MTQSQRKKRTRKDLRIAERVLPRADAIQLPKWCRAFWRHHRYVVVYGGRGGTRSWSCARVLLLLAAKSKHRILCAREIQSSIRDSVHQLLRDQIELMHLTGFIVTDREIRHVNGSVFIFKGIRHNATTIKSMEAVDICWVEEAERITKESWSILIPTIRKQGSQIWVTFNPDQEDDATYKRFILNPPAGCIAIKVGWEDNPWLSEELRAEKDYMYATDPEAADWVWGGNIRRISDAQILKGKWEIREFTVPVVVDPSGQRVPLWDGPYQGQDFGFGSDPAAAIRLWVQDEILYVEHEGWKLHLEIDQTADTWNDAFKSNPSDPADFHLYTTRADSSRPDTISYLRRHGLPRIRPAKKHAGSVADGIAHLRSYRKIIIHPRCSHFIQECKLYSYKVDPRSGDVLPIIVDKHNHLMDSARYALDPLIKPKRRVGLDFLDEEQTTVCPECESLLPDDGECVHCGFNIHAPEPDLSSMRELVAAVMTEPEEDAPRVDHRHTNGNGNGHHTNGNGHSNGNGKTSMMSRLRGINDDL